jgi:hypothetical protein
MFLSEWSWRQGGFLTLGSVASTQSSALSSALSSLRTSVSDLAAQPGASTVSGVVTAVRGVSTAGQNLLAAVNPSCPSPSPSST